MPGWGIGCSETLFPIADALAICECIHKFAAVFIGKTNVLCILKSFFSQSLSSIDKVSKTLMRVINFHETTGSALLR